MAVLASGCILAGGDDEDLIGLQFAALEAVGLLQGGKVDVHLLGNGCEGVAALNFVGFFRQAVPAEKKGYEQDAKSHPEENPPSHDEVPP